MAKTSDIITILHGHEAQLFQGDQGLFDTLEFTLSDLSFEGLAVTVPEKIQTDTMQELPVILVSQQTVLRGWQVSEQNNLLLALIDLNTGTVRTVPISTDAKAGENSGSQTPGRPPQPNPQAGAALETKIRKVDARPHFAIPWNTGAYSVVAFCYDWASNAARVELMGKEKIDPTFFSVSPRPMESAQYGWIPTSYIPGDKTPPAPQVGVAFHVDPALTNERLVVAAGSFTKKLGANEILPAPETLKDHDTAQEVYAVVPITFMILGLDWKVPRLREMGIPIYRAGAGTDDKAAHGYFWVDVLAQEEAPLTKGRYVLYAFLEGVAYGPEYFDIP